MLGVLLVVVGSVGLIVLGVLSNPQETLDRIQNHEGDEAQSLRSQLLKKKQTRQSLLILAAGAVIVGFYLLVA